jgi:L-methionine (R)-S-oxide reductase
MDRKQKDAEYGKTLRRIGALIAGETDLVSIMSTAACELYHAFEYFNWVGFYRRVSRATLKVGPYQGSHGCLTIDIRRGVCGACVRAAAVQIENDVSKAPAHIACSADTKAEIVLPVLNRSGDVVAVLDIDSTRLNVFDKVDVKHLSRVCAWVAERCRENRSFEEGDACFPHS